MVAHMRRAGAPPVAPISYGPSAIATSAVRKRTVSTVILRRPALACDDASVPGHDRVPAAPPLAGRRVLIGVGGEQRPDGRRVTPIAGIEVIADDVADCGFVGLALGGLRRRRHRHEHETADSEEHSHSTILAPPVFSRWHARVSFHR